MHEYAYYGRGNSIHSPGQIEQFKNTYDDESFHLVGKQVITFLDGHAPLQCRTGLMYMDLLGNLQTLIWTSIHMSFSLDPMNGSLCFRFYPSHLLWRPCLGPDPADQDCHDHMVDEYGNFKGRIIQNLFILAKSPLLSRKMK